MSVTALPTPPQRSDPTNFPARGDAFLSALPQFGVECNALAADVNAKQVLADTSATNAAASEVNAAASASAAVAAGGASLWVSGTTYAVGDCRFSPTTYQTYRRKTSGGGSTDPSSDPANWVQISQSGMVLLASLTPSVGTLLSLPNVFTSSYDNYLIVINGIGLEDRGSSSGVITLTICVGGVPVSTNSYANIVTSNSDVSALGSTDVTITRAALYAATNSNYNAEIKIKNVNSTGIKAIRTTAEYTGMAGVPVYSCCDISTLFDGGVASGFQITVNSNARFYAQGKIRVYGITN